MFPAQPSRFASEVAKIYLINLLEGPPFQYVNALLERDSSLTSTVGSLTTELKQENLLSTFHLSYLTTRLMIHGFFNYVLT